MYAKIVYDHYYSSGNKERITEVYSLVQKLIDKDQLIYEYYWLNDSKMLSDISFKTVEEARLDIFRRYNDKNLISMHFDKDFIK